MENPFVPPHAPDKPVKVLKEDKPPRVKSGRSVISEVASIGAHGRVGREQAKLIIAALEAAGLEIRSKPYVKPVEAKRKPPEAVKPPAAAAAPSGMYVPPVLHPAPDPVTG